MTGGGGAAGLFDAAFDAHRRGDLDAAADLYDASLAATPDDPELLRLSGLLRFQRGELAAAHASLARAVELAPAYAAAHSDFGLILTASGDPAAALAEIDAALGLEPDAPDTLGRRAAALLALDRAEEAIACYNRVLDLAPLHVETVYNLGGAFARLGRWDAARDCYDAAIALCIDHAAAWNNRGIALKNLGRPAAALASFDTALELRPGHVETLCNRGTALAALGRHGEALRCFDKVLSRQPDHVAALFNQGNTLAALDMTDGALDCFAALLAIAPDHRGARLNQGVLLHKLSRNDEALAAFDDFCTRFPDDPDALYNRGTVLIALGRDDAAVEGFTAALAQAPRRADIRENRARALTGLGRCDEALADADAALAAAASPGAWNARGQALTGLGRLAEALAAHDAALALDRDDLDAWHSRGLVLDDLGRPAEALDSYAHALALSPSNPDIRFCASLSRLMLGDTATGWLEHEVRGRRSNHPVAVHHADLPRWQGEPLDGGTLLLHAEQGLGDTLQFCRFVPLAAARGAWVVVEAQTPLLPLLARLPGVAAARAHIETTGSVLAAECPFPSLPLALGIDGEAVAAAAPPYLSVPEDRAALWHERLGAKTRRRIGIVWSGRAEHRKGPHLKRSLPLDLLLDRLPADAEVYALQKDISAADAGRLRARPFSHVLADDLADFADTAAVAMEMDAVLTIDTSVAHLVGGLGLPARILLPFSADWRWGIERHSTPWYPAARLFRQPAPGDWVTPLDRAVADLT